MSTALERYLEIIWSEEDVPTVLEAHESMMSIATKEDLPKLVTALGSDRNNFWTRELIAEPIAYLGGADHLHELLEALEKNTADGHDSDSLAHFLMEIAELKPTECRAQLVALELKSPALYSEYANWLLEFCALHENQSL